MGEVLQLSHYQVSNLRYFALFFPADNPEDRHGYVLDYYPEERDLYISEEGENIIGDFKTYNEAMTAIVATMRRGLD